MKLSIAIPCYEMGGHGIEMLTCAINSIKEQTFIDYEIVVSDHSIDNELYELCQSYNLNIKYYRNPDKRGSSSANINNAIMHCTGDIIKILCQDDYLADSFSLEHTVSAFDESTQWLVSSYLVTRDRITIARHYLPRWNNKIYIENTIGTHSCLTIRNDPPILFDENLIFYMDCEYYYRLYQKYGLPKILSNPTVVQLLWPGQVSNTLITDNLDQAERNYVIRKHEK